MTKRASSWDRGRNPPTFFVVGGTPGHERTPVGLDTDVAPHITDRLRAMYDSVLREPLPDRFLDLLLERDDRTVGTKVATPKPLTVKQSDDAR